MQSLDFEAAPWTEMSLYLPAPLPSVVPKPKGPKTQTGHQIHTLKLQKPANWALPNPKFFCAHFHIIHCLGRPLAWASNANRHQTNQDCLERKEQNQDLSVFMYLIIDLQPRMVTFSDKVRLKRRSNTN